MWNRKKADSIFSTFKKVTHYYFGTYDRNQLPISQFWSTRRCLYSLWVQSYTYAPHVRFVVAPIANPTPCSRMGQERDRYKPCLLVPAVAISSWRTNAINAPLAIGTAGKRFLGYWKAIPIPIDLRSMSLTYLEWERLKLLRTIQVSTGI